MGKLLSHLQRRGYLMSDGAMGTELFKVGLQSGDAPELWNVDKGDLVQSVYRQYVEAGSDIILSNTFGGNRYRLSLHEAEGRVKELNAKGVALAKEVIEEVVEESGREVLVAASMGPTGEILAPVGSLSEADAEAAFCEQAEGLLSGGADILWVETMSSLEEVAAAVCGGDRAIKDGNYDCDIVATLTFDTNGRTMMGVEPSAAVAFFRDFEIPVAAFGLNCGLGPAETVASLLAMAEAKDDDMVLVCQSNCGIPEYREGHFHFSGTPELMGAYARLAYGCGARIIGGCCGSDGEIMRVIREVLDGLDDVPKPDLAAIIAELGEISDSAVGIHSGEGAKRERKSRRKT